MSYTEADVSILIPSYRRPTMTRTAVESALATGAGEIVVSDDASDDGTPEALADLHDPRLRVVVQERNLGLWPNHLALLRMASRPWVKFLQNDDRLEPGGLGLMVEQTGPETTVVGGVSLYERQETGERYSEFTLTRPRRWSSDQYLQRCTRVVNELGTPSDALWRLDALDLSEQAWRTDMSCDWIANVVAASHGEVVLLPPGPVLTVDHPGRDTFHQGLEMFFRRIGNSSAYLLRSSDPRLRRVGRIYRMVDTIASLRIAIGSVRRGGHLYPGFPKQWVRQFAGALSPSLLPDIGNVARMLRWRWSAQSRRCMDAD